MHFLVLLSALVACAAGVPLDFTKPALDGRIVGGKPTQIENHPHQVVLQYFGSFWCSGSIISPNWIVTAAHCVMWLDASFLTVRAGSTHLSFSGTIHHVIGGHIHDSFNAGNADYDVAVLQVDPPFTYSDRVRNITLQDSNIPAGTSVFVSGWGRTSWGGPISFNLLEAIVEIRHDDVCRDAYCRRFTDSMICAGSPSGNRGPCHGDSGGPLTTIHFPRRLVGIVSWGPSDCGYAEYPAVYAKVSVVRDWIIAHCGL